ncbi:MAG TPA: thiamine-phosphate kinase [Nocardioidaceae bacterium]|nr:thiamine-phosphate kinase [Nocardioidaceae bacterium]
MADPRSRPLSEVGEFELVSEITSVFSPGERVLVGPGDDAAVVARSDGPVVASLDLLVQDRHFRLDWSSAADVGHKAAAANLSDINAMGGRATGLLVGLALPGDLELGWVLDFAAGLAEEAALVGASVVGGDVSSADRIAVAVSVLGECPARVVTRAGARPGDLVGLAGRQGWAAAGQAVLARGFRSPRAVVEAHRRPQPPYSAGLDAAAAGATAMVDVSDGLVQDLGHLARSSAVAIDVSAADLDVAEPLRSVGAALGMDPVRFVLTGGEDYSLAATFPDGTRLPAGWATIGWVLVDGEPGRVTVDGSAYDAPGHQHFRS